MADRKVRKGPASPEQLPQGAATQVNEALAAVPEAAPEAPVEAAPSEAPPEAPVPAAAPSLIQAQPAIQAPAPATGSFRPKEARDETGAFLYSDGPGLRPRPLHARPPDEVVAWLPALARAATQPGAPPTLRALLGVILEALERED